MCEIAILKPEYDDVQFTDIAFKMYQRMGSSLGVAAVLKTDGKFSYDIYRNIEPTRDGVEAYFRRTLSLDPDFYIIHARLKTHGAVIDEHAHPLEIDCDQCDVDYVVHNGVVSGHWQFKQDHKDNGHVYSTGVDSEAIAHEFGEVPNNFDHNALPEFSYQPAFILMNSERIYIMSEGTGYQLTDAPEMTRSQRQFGPSNRETNYAQVIVDATVNND